MVVFPLRYQWQLVVSISCRKVEKIQFAQRGILSIGFESLDPRNAGQIGYCYLAFVNHCTFNVCQFFEKTDVYQLQWMWSRLRCGVDSRPYLTAKHETLSFLQITFSLPISMVTVGRIYDSICRPSNGDVKQTVLSGWNSGYGSFQSPNLQHTSRLQNSAYIGPLINQYILQIPKKIRGNRQIL